MLNIYIDESGSMRNPPTNYNDQFFFISMLVLDSAQSKYLKRRKRKYVRSNMEQLKNENQITLLRNKHRSEKTTMFNDNKFLELKGSCLSFGTKKDILSNIFLRNSLLKDSLFLVEVDNARTRKNFFADTERAFNYLLRISLITLARKKNIKENNITIHIDNRNIANSSINGLEKYLNHELCVKTEIYNSITVLYYNSEDSDHIQVIDLVANIHFSSRDDRRARQVLSKFVQEEIIIQLFKFPL